MATQSAYIGDLANTMNPTQRCLLAAIVNQSNTVEPLGPYCSDATVRYVSRAFAIAAIDEMYSALSDIGRAHADDIRRILAD